MRNAGGAQHALRVAAERRDRWAAEDAPQLNRIVDVAGVGDAEQPRRLGVGERAVEEVSRRRGKRHERGIGAVADAVAAVGVATDDARVAEQQELRPARTGVRRERVELGRLQLRVARRVDDLGHAAVHG